MIDADGQKTAAGEAAALFVQDGMTLGLGTGSTAAKFVTAVARRAKAEGLQLTCVSTSEATEALARSLGLVTRALDEVDVIDLTVDGADEIGPGLSLITGGGAALLREKLFPRLLREARRSAGSHSRAKATPREEALLMGFHGGLIYHLGIWPLVYQQHFAGEGDVPMVDTFIADRIRGLLAQMPEVLPSAGARR